MLEPPKEQVATRDGYGKGLLALGRVNPNVVALDADLAESTRSQWFQREFPSRFFQMGISEQDMMLTAAGLAASGKIPFASTFAIFAERGFEQVRNGIARPNLNVKIVGSHGGLITGEDGASAQCIEDMAIYRSLPNFTVCQPTDAVETEQMVFRFAEHKGPCYMKLTRAKVPVLFDKNQETKLGQAYVLRDGADVTIVANGPMVWESLIAADALSKDHVSARVVAMSTVKPVDKDVLVRAARETGAIVTAEDHNIIGGLGGAVAETLAEEYPTPVERIGVRDTFGESGSPKDLYKKYGLTAEHIALAAKKAVARKSHARNGR